MRYGTRRRPWDFDPNKVQSSKIAERDVQETLDELRKLLVYRDHSIKWNTTLGPKLSGREIYDSLIPPEVSALISEVRQYPEWERAVNTDDTPKLYLVNISTNKAFSKAFNVNPTSDAHPVRFILDLPEKRPCSKVGWSDGMLMYPDHPMYPLLLDYANQLQLVDKQNDQTLETSNELMHVCNTWGQVRRLWPEVFTFLPTGTGKVRVVKEQKQQSRLPPALTEDADRLTSLITRRDEANRILTQAVLLKSMGNPPPRTTTL